MLFACAAGATATEAAEPPQWRANGRVLTADQREAFIAFGEVSVPELELHCREVYSGVAFNQAGRGVAEVDGLTSSCTGITPLECVLSPKHPNCVEPVLLTAEMPIGADAEEQGEVCTGAPEKPPSECPMTDERTIETLFRSVRRGSSSLPWKGELTERVGEGESVTLLRLGEGRFGEAAEAGSQVPESGACYPTETVASEGGAPETVAAGWQRLPAGCLALNFFLPDTPTEVVLFGGMDLEVVNGSKTALFPSRLINDDEDSPLWRSGAASDEGYEVLSELRILGTAGLALLSAT